MKNILKKIPILLSVLVLSLLVTACPPATLEDYFRETSMQDEFQAIAEQQSTDDISASYYVKDNTVVFEYQINEVVDSSEASMLGQMLDYDSFKQPFESFAMELRDRTRVNSITVKVIYKDANGSVIAEKEYDPAN